VFFVDINKLKYLDELRMLPKHSDICILDLSEVERLWPLDTNKNYGEVGQRKLVHNITQQLQTHPKDIYYISSDCNIYKRYEKWCMTSPPKKLKVYCFPFSDVPKVKVVDSFTYSYNDMLIKLKGSDDGWDPHENSINDYKKCLNRKKIKNFIVLTCSPKLIRILFLDKFYKHDKMEYSFFPFYHIDNTDDISFSNFDVKIPYKWTKDGQRMWVDDKGQNYKDIPLDAPFLNSRVQKLENGFNFQEHVRELNEFIFEWAPNKLNKDIFNESLPIEVFNSCCDIVFESYTSSDSVFFTEKSWKEIIFKRPYITFGAKHQYKIFEKLGFKIYDEVFNYDFDSGDTLQNRFEKFTDQIEYFLNYNTKEFENKIKTLNEKINYNFDLYVKYLEKHKYSLMLQKFKQDEEMVVESNGEIFKKSLVELEESKQILE
jgi:hypothetical protein